LIIFSQKVIVTARTWESYVRKAKRVLAETTITGVKTNLALLQAILHHDNFLTRKVDTQWLERNLDSLNQGANQAISRRNNNEQALSFSQSSFSPADYRAEATTTTTTTP